LRLASQWASAPLGTPNKLLIGVLAHLLFAGSRLCRHVFQGVHMLLQFSSSKEGAGRPWRPDEKRYCKLVFIGKNLDRKELTDAFNACLVTN
jgi:G3E family GTPase